MTKILVIAATLLSVNGFAAPTTKVVGGSFQVRAWNCSELERSSDLVSPNLYLGQTFFHSEQDKTGGLPAFLFDTQIDNYGNVYVANTPVAHFDPQDLRAQLRKSCDKPRSHNSSEYLRYEFKLNPGTDLSVQTGKTSTPCRWTGTIGNGRGRMSTLNTTIVTPQGKPAAVGTYSSENGCATLSTTLAGVATTLFVEIPVITLKRIRDSFYESLRGE